MWKIFVKKQDINSLLQLELPITWAKVEKAALSIHLSFSQFSYCPLIWMFHNRKLNYRINKMYERALRIALNDHQCTFEELFE